MKKYLTLIAVVVLCAIFSMFFVGCDSEIEAKQLSTVNDAKLNTLILSDVRFDGTSADEVRKDMITKMVNDKKNLEFIAITGNLVNAQNNGEVMQQAVQFIDSFNIPWAMSLGELDVKGKDSAKKIMSIITDKKLKNSMVMRGNSYKNNYCIEVVKTNGNVSNLLYFIDTSVECSDELVEWYKNSLKNISFKYSSVQGKLINSHIFMNRPLPIYSQYQGKNGEVSAWKNGEKLQNEIIKQGSTKSVIAGFDIENYYQFDKNSVNWAYAKSMAFDSKMDMNDKNFVNQSKITGCTYCEYSDSSSIYFNFKSYSPIAK